MRQNLTVLLLMPVASRARTLELLDGCPGQVFAAGGLEEARRALARQAVDVVLTGATLADGDWKSVLEHIQREGMRSEVVVCARAFDSRLCAEVFNRGVYDLLVEPYSREELARVLEGAAARKYMRGLAGKSGTAPLRAAS